MNRSIIPNSQQYMFEEKYVSIHSEDRNIVKYPNASEFEIELPQDYCHVQGIKLASWSFPHNYNTFSISQKNITMSFFIVRQIPPRNPTTLEQAVFECLQKNYKNPFSATITEGSYDPYTMAQELTNRMNESINTYLLGCLNGSEIIQEFLSNGGYSDFKVVYNQVKSNLWFGNLNAKFIIPNNENNIFLRNAQLGKFQYPVYSNWGLGSYLGFVKNTPVESVESPKCEDQYIYPRFYYENGSKSYWLTDGSSSGVTPVFYLETPRKLNIEANRCIYMEVDLLNSMDEYVPYDLNSFTVHTNESNGIVNSAFAKIPLQCSNQIYNFADSLKIYNPSAERISKLKFRFRYHNGLLVDFDNNNYTFTLLFTLYRPQNQKKMHMFIPETIAFN